MWERDTRICTSGGQRLSAGAMIYAALASANEPTPGHCLAGKQVAIVGIGGLGHIAIQFAKAMGADGVVAISRRRNKRHDSLDLGAREHIATDQDGDWPQKYPNTVDLIIHLRQRGGRYVLLGIPGDGGVVSFESNIVVLKQIEITGSLICSPSQMRNMLRFAAEHDIKPWVEEIEIADANQAIRNMEAGQARYRIVLCNRDNNEARL